MTRLSYSDAQAHPQPCACGRLVTRPEQCDMRQPPQWRQVRRCPFDKTITRGLWAQADEEAMSE